MPHRRVAVWVGGFFRSLSFERESRCRRWPLHPGYFTVSEESRKHHTSRRPPECALTGSDTGRSRTDAVVEWNVSQFDRTSFIRSNPDQDTPNRVDELLQFNGS